VAAGTPEEVMANPKSLTGQYLSGKRKIAVPKPRRKGNGNFLKVVGAAENNLKNMDVAIPLGTFTCVTGVSGSGKSSLVNEILFKKLGAELMRMKTRPGKCKRIEGLEFLDKVVDIDQSPIGRTPRSPTPPPIRAFSTTSGTCLPPRRRPRAGATVRAGFQLQRPGRAVRGLLRRRPH
jgi:excinuclease ABC subunit A